MTAPVQAPAASYACLVGRTGCRACRPDPFPCPEFKDYLGSPWCAECGWTGWSHEAGDPK